MNRKWMLWTAVIPLMLGCSIIERLSSLPTPQSGRPRATETQPVAPVFTPSPTKSAIPSKTATVSPTQIPARWVLQSDGAFLPRNRAMSIRYDQDNPQIVYMGTEFEGVFKSADGGSTWNPINQSLDGIAVYGLALDPNNPETVYASVSQKGVYRSVAAGEEWRRLTPDDISLAAYWWFSGIHISPNNSKRLYYLNGFVFRSTDGGSNWNRMTFQDIHGEECPDGIGWVVESPGNPQTLLAQYYGFGDSCPGGIYRSIDDGKNWTASSMPAPIFGAGWGEKVIFSPDGKTVFYFPQDNGFFTSVDEGLTWKKTSAMETTACALGSMDGRIVFCADRWDALYRSQNFGASWSALPWRNGEINSIAADYQNPNNLLVGGVGVYRSADGGTTWTPGKGLGNMPLEFIGTPPDVENDLLYLEEYRLGGFGGAPLYSSADKGVQWKQLTVEGHGLSFDADGKTLYRGNYDGIYRSRDLGLTWMGISVPGHYHGGIPAADPVLSGKVYLTFSQPASLYTSDNFGASWTPAAEALNLRNGMARLLFGTDTDLYLYGPDMPPSHSPDSGKTWRDCGPLSSNGLISSMVIGRQNPQKIWITTRGGGINYSQDGCKTFAMRNIERESPVILSVAVDPTDDRIVYAATNLGVYASEDEGLHWSLMSQGLSPFTIVYSIFVDSQSDVVAATDRGIYRLEWLNS